MREVDFYGGGRVDSISSNLILPIKGPRSRYIAASTSNLKVVLPSALISPLGFDVFSIFNIGVIDVTITDKNLNFVAVLPQHSVAYVGLVNKSSVNGQWVVLVKSISGFPVLPIKTFAAVLGASVNITTVLEVASSRSLQARLQISTNFAGQLTFSNEKKLSATLGAATDFRCIFNSFPTAKIISSTATGSGDGSTGNPWTLKQAASLLAPGETAYLRGGNYSDVANNKIDSVSSTVISGNSSNYITYKNYPGEVPTLNGQNVIKNVQYVVFQGIKFGSIGGSWISTTTGTGTHRNIKFLDCEFNSVQGPGNFSGMIIYNGTDFVFQRCRFVKWYNGDTMQFSSTPQCLFEDCDFWNNDATHASLAMLNCSSTVIRRCSFRNAWDRTITLRTTTGSKMLVEECVFLDCDWNGTDFHPFDAEGGQGDTECCRLMSERMIFRNNIVVGYNGGKYNRSPTGYAYAAAVQTAFYDAYNTINKIRVYNNVVHRSKPNALTFEYNVSSGETISAEDYRYKNNSFSGVIRYCINVAKSIFPWETWLFEKNRIYSLNKTNLIFLKGETPQEYTVASAETKNGTVFKNNITSAPQFVNEALYDQMDADPSLFGHRDLSRWFDAFKESAGGTGIGQGTHLCEVTQNGTAVTTINVDDAYYLFPTTNWYVGDKILIGASATVYTVTAINSQTQLTITPAATVTIGDKIYLERMGKTPDIGIYPLEIGMSKNLAGVFSIGTAFAGKFIRDTRKLPAILSIGTNFAVNVTKSLNIFELTHESGNFDEYTGAVVGGGDLYIDTPAGMDGTIKGLVVNINDTGSIYGQKDFVWTTQYLRFRFYIDPNSITMANNDDFYLLLFKSAGGQESAYVRMKKLSSGYKVYAAARDDAGIYSVTANVDLSDAPHYIEVEYKRAANSTSVDGHTKIWLDGSLISTVSNLDIFDVARPVYVLVGAAKGIDAGTSGSIYLDEIFLRDNSTEIGA